MGMDQALDMEGQPMPQGKPMMAGPIHSPVPHVEMESALASLTDLVRVARRKSMEMGGAIVSTPIKAYGRTLAICKVQVPPGAREMDAKLWWEPVAKVGQGCFR
jgi:hypothetical protein